VHDATPLTSSAAPASTSGSAADQLWYKDAVVYQLHVRAFCDANGDGIGDFRGLRQRLGYLQDLGVTALWLLPFYPSPLRDDGYDIADYQDVHPDYGTLLEFRELLDDAHRRGLRVITELVCNHTSDQHPWFQRARHAPAGSPERDFYVWSDTPDRYQQARIIFKDFETSNWAWDPVARAYYWHRFYSHQPDLNFDHPPVRAALLQVVDFWLGLGVDGLRLDAVPYLFERDGTSCENLPETHAFLRDLRRHVDERFPGRMLLAEANQWPEDAVAYFGAGDECHMAFHFPLMPRVFMALSMEDRFPIADVLAQTPPIPDSAQWALFLRNHDELTLEMVTDEERDYMCRAYAQDPRMRINMGIRRRLAPLLQNNRRRRELVNALLLSSPGTPVLYYGDEIGMGDNIYLGDRNGVRTPMQWSPDRNAGFSQANRQQLYLPVIVDPEYHYEAVNVETQENNQQSSLWWMKRLIALRKQVRAFGRGDYELLQPTNHKVLAYVRRHEEERILVVANLSRFSQSVSLDLRPWQGLVPVELFGRVEFPTIGEAPYTLSLGPHGFFWFSFEAQRSAAEVTTAPDALRAPRTLAAGGSLQAVLAAPARARLEALLPDHVRPRRWFTGRGQQVKAARIVDVLPLGPSQDAALLLVEVSYFAEEPETYVLPLAIARGDEAARVLREAPHAIVALVDGGALHDALYSPAFCEALAALGDAVVRGERGELRLSVAGDRPDAVAALACAPRVLDVEQSNTSVVFGERALLKVFRRLEPGLNPELKVPRFLAEQGFTSVARPLAALEYRPLHDRRADVAIVGVFSEFVPSRSDAWSHALELVGQCFERALTRSEPIEPASPNDALALAAQEPPALVQEVIGAYLDVARQLGALTAELHLTLGSAPSARPDFAPEPITTLYQRELYQSLRNLAGRTHRELSQRLARLPEATRPVAAAFLADEPRLGRRLRRVLEQRLDGLRITHHGDYHLGQILVTDRGFVVIDFEGEATRSIADRRHKRSPLRDVASMLLSFHRVARTALASGTQRPEDAPRLRGWASLWEAWVSAAFLRAYLSTGVVRLLPPEPEGRQALLDAHLLGKALQQLRADLDGPPERVVWSLDKLNDLLGAPGRGGEAPLAPVAT
jgi:maltose alpha-D-glucosyltransferase/alpha-amylase